MKFTIPIQPITKKNSQQIIQCKGGPIIIPSKQYKQYERDCKIFLPDSAPIDTPVNIKCVYYMRTRGRIDLTNLLSATMDTLVHHRVIIDDNRNIAVSHDGSIVLYDKDNPRAEIEITPIENYERWGKCSENSK